MAAMPFIDFGVKAMGFGVKAMGFGVKAMGVRSHVVYRFWCDDLRMCFCPKSLQ